MVNCCNPRGEIMIQLGYKILPENNLSKIRVVRDSAFWAKPALPSHPPPGDSLQMSVSRWIAYFSQLIRLRGSFGRHRFGSGGRIPESIGGSVGEVEGG